MTLVEVTFAAPNRLWALILIPVIAALYLLLNNRKKVAAPVTRLGRIIPQDKAWKRHSAVLLALASLASLIVAWALPQDWATKPRDRATIVVAIDVSWSMEAQDVDPNRLKAAQEGAKNFISSLPERFNVALVTFAGTAKVAVPPTVDRGMVARAIDSLELAPSTAVGEGIYTSLDSLALAPPDPDDPNATPPAAIVLLSDGETNMGRSSEGAAKVAAERGVPVYTIAYGTADGYVEQDGQRQRVAVNSDEMRGIARASGGKAYSAETLKELREVYQDIRQEVGVEKVLSEVTDRFAGYAIVFAVAAALGVISLGARWP